MEIVTVDRLQIEQSESCSLSSEDRIRVIDMAMKDTVEGG